MILLDVYHWSCLNKYAASLPSTTAPAGYQCPKCKECIFPPSNLVSPVVDALKSKLLQTSWAKIGLGEQNDGASPVIEDEKNDYVIVSNKASTASKILNARNNDYPFLHSTKQNKSEIYRAYNPTNDINAKSHSRSNFNKDDGGSSTSPLVLNISTDRDSDENKYKRRPVFEWFGRLLK